MQGITGSSDRPLVAVIGGGIAGLAAAYRLSQVPSRVNAVLIERESRLGGKILTERADGFIVEAGPDSFLSSKPWALDLCRQLGLEGELEGPDPTRRGTFVMRDGRLLPIPEGLSGLVPSRLEPFLRSELLSPPGKMRLLLDLLLPARAPGGDESLAAFIRRRLGGEAYERLVEPLMGGIYAGDGAQLSLAATFPQLRSLEREHGSLIRGIRAAGRQGPADMDGQRLPAFLTLRGGMGEMVEALHSRLPPGVVQLSATARRVRAGSRGYLIEVDDGALEADAVILATPAYVTADLVRALDGALAGTLESIPYVSTATMSLAYRASDLPRPLQGYGYIVPRREGRPVLACTWSSSKFPDRAPADHALLRLFVGRAGQDDVVERCDADLLNLARAELGAALGIEAQPALTRLFRWTRAMPQYTMGHQDRLFAIERRLAAHPGLSVAGSAYRGVGLPDCVRSGVAAAESALVYLQKESEAG